MTRRLPRSLLYLLAACQLLAAPVVSALAAEPASSMHCADMASPEDQDACPCCPEGIANMAQCMANCAAAVAMTLPFQVISPAMEAPQISTTLLVASALRSDPPLKPPPIR